MKLALSAFLSIVALVSAHTAAAQTFTPAPGWGALALDLDTEEGRFSVWEVRDLCGINAMRATVSAPRLGTHARWRPLISFRVGTGTEEAILQIWAPQRRPPLQVNVLRYDDDGERSQDGALPVSLEADGSIEVGFDWETDGRVKIIAGGVHHYIQLSGVPTRLAISNSTGEARIDPLRLGYVGAQPSCPLAD